MIKSLSLILSFLIVPSFAGALESSGEVIYEYRRFDDDRKEETVDSGQAVFSRLQVKDSWGSFEYRVKAFSRTDQKDSDRSFVAIEDAHILRRFGENEDITLLVGYKVFNWSATEAFHPADVINSRNLDGELENLEKKGELTFEFLKEFEEGTLSFYFWPRFESPELPGAKSRLGGGIDIGKSVVVDGQDATTNSKWHNQFGVRFSFILDSADISFHYIKHIDRNMPLYGFHQYSTTFAGTPLNFPTVTEVQPHYYWVNQFGGTLQASLGSMLIKFEGAYRIFEDGFPTLVLVEGTTNSFETRVQPEHSEIAVGLEYPISGTGSGDLTLIAEAQSIFGVGRADRVKLSLFQREAMIGARYAFNDVMGTELFTSFILDLERDHEYIMNLSVARRIADDWKFKTGVRFYDAPMKGDSPVGLEGLDGDHYYYFNLIKYF